MKEKTKEEKRKEEKKNKENEMECAIEGCGRSIRVRRNFKSIWPMRPPLRRDIDIYKLKRGEAEKMKICTTCYNQYREEKKTVKAYEMILKEWNKYKKEEVYDLITHLRTKSKTYHQRPTVGEQATATTTTTTIETQPTTPQKEDDIRYTKKTQQQVAQQQQQEEEEQQNQQEFYVNQQQQQQQIKKMQQMQKQIQKQKQKMKRKTTMTTNNKKNIEEVTPPNQTKRSKIEQQVSTSSSDEETDRKLTLSSSSDEETTNKMQQSSSSSDEELELKNKMQRSSSSDEEADEPHMKASNSLDEIMEIPKTNKNNNKMQQSSSSSDEEQETRKPYNKTIQKLKQTKTLDSDSSSDGRRPTPRAEIHHYEMKTKFEMEMAKNKIKFDMLLCHLPVPLLLTFIKNIGLSIPVVYRLNERGQALIKYELNHLTGLLFDWNPALVYYFYVNVNNQPAMYRLDIITKNDFHAEKQGISTSPGAPYYRLPFHQFHFYKMNVPMEQIKGLPLIKGSNAATPMALYEAAENFRFLKDGLFVNHQFLPIFGYTHYEKTNFAITTIKPQQQQRLKKKKYRKM